MECCGDGSCFIQCRCDCFADCECECNSNTDCTKEFDNNGEEVGCDGTCCNCTHIDNCEWINGIHKDCTFDWCLAPTNCQYNCEFQECNNYPICKKKAAQWYLNCHQGCCGPNCCIQYGPLTFSEEDVECCICFENKKLVKLICNHAFCFDCITTLHENTCPLCRSEIRFKMKK